MSAGKGASLTGLPARSHPCFHRAAISACHLLRAFPPFDCAESLPLHLFVVNTPRFPEESWHRRLRKHRSAARGILVAAKFGADISEVSIARARGRLINHHGTPKEIGGGKDRGNDTREWYCKDKQCTRFNNGDMFKNRPFRGECFKCGGSRKSNNIFGGFVPPKTPSVHVRAKGKQESNNAWTPAAVEARELKAELEKKNREIKELRKKHGQSVGQSSSGVGGGDSGSGAESMDVDADAAEPTEQNLAKDLAMYNEFIAALKKRGRKDDDPELLAWNEKVSELKSKREAGKPCHVQFKDFAKSMREQEQRMDQLKSKHEAGVQQVKKIQSQLATFQMQMEHCKKEMDNIRAKQEQLAKSLQPKQVTEIPSVHLPTADRHADVLCAVLDRYLGAEGRKKVLEEVASLDNPATPSPARSAGDTDLSRLSDPATSVPVSAHANAVVQAGDGRAPVPVETSMEADDLEVRIQRHTQEAEELREEQKRRRLEDGTAA